MSRCLARAEAFPNILLHRLHSWGLVLVSYPWFEGGGERANTLSSPGVRGDSSLLPGLEELLKMELESGTVWGEME